MKNLYLLIGALLLAALPGWAQADSSKPAIHLSFLIDGTAQQRSLETRPTVVTRDGGTCEIKIGQDEDPVEWIKLEVTPTLVEQGRVELEQRLVVQVGERIFERKVKLVSLLGVPATVEFKEDDLEVKLTVTPTLWEQE